MQPSVIKDIKAVLDTAYLAINRKNYFSLEGLSNRLNNSIAAYRDKCTAQTSVVIFALGKIVKKKAYLNHSSFEEFRKTSLSDLKQASLALQKDDVKIYLTSMNLLKNKINKFSLALKLYNEPLMSYSASVKARHAVEHGLSVSQASKLFSIPEWNISKQVGKSSTYEKHYAPTKFNKKRIELVKRLFKI